MYLQIPRLLAVFTVKHTAELSWGFVFDMNKRKYFRAVLQQVECKPGFETLTAPKIQEVGFEQLEIDFYLW